MSNFLTGRTDASTRTSATVDEFTGGVGFTAGSSTTVTLTSDPGTENDCTITFDGVTQHRTTWSVSGTTVTFDAAIPTGTLKVEATYSSTYAVGTVPTNSVNSTQLADNAVTSGKMAYSAYAKNLIINGGFQVNQRVYVSTTATADGTYMHDRWRSGSTDSSYTFSTASPCSPQTITIAANGSIEQVIEDVNVGTSGTHTISWTGTATCRAVVNTQTMSGNFAVSPVAVTAVAGQVITLQFTGADAAGGSTEATDTGTLGDVQCEVGSTASDFEVENIGSVTAKCQRYYSKSYLHTVALGTVTDVGTYQGMSPTTTGVYTVPFPVEMRTTATMVWYDPNNGASGTWYNASTGGHLTTTTGAGGSGHAVANVASTASTHVNRGHWSADAEL